jgi:hypothetical protein
MLKSALTKAPSPLRSAGALQIRHTPDEGHNSHQLEETL